MSNKSKKIELDLFKPYFIQTDENGITREYVYDLSPFLKHISKISFTQTKRKIYGDNRKIVTINLGFGKKRKRFLNKTVAIQLLKEAYYFSGTEKLIASMSESEDGKCVNVDLLDDREKIVFEMQYSRENPITHERIYNECLSKI